MKSKHLRGGLVEVWVHKERKYFRGASIVWKGLVKDFTILEKWVA